MHKLAASLMVMLAVTAFGIGEEGFKPLFDGRTLNGWVRRGGEARYSVEDGAIVGRVHDAKRNTFLCTEREYADFILRMDFKFEGDNSGVQFRSGVHNLGKPGEHLFGYQYEIAAPHLTGRIHDEHRRGFKFDRIWLDNTSDEVIKRSVAAYKQGDWNALEIQCIGPSLRTWVNGVAVANIFDDQTLSGIIGLQVHSSRAETGSVNCRWRNIRIKELGESKWHPFFVKGADGKYKLQDARFVLPDNWEFRDDGILVGKHSKDEKRDGLVVSDRNYSDFIVKVSYQLFGGNSGLYFRAEEVNTPWLLRGFQNEIAGNAKDSAIWHTAGDKTPGRGWIAQNDEFIGKVRKAEGWNTTTTAAFGDRIFNLLNGQRTIDLVDPEGEKSGKVGLQLHGSADVEMWFKDFEIIEITPEMGKLIGRE